jgi:NADP-dependent 3-hydroxy acid dehydrogenase YdfG
MNALRNKLAVVTGASSGIGKAISLGLAKKGVTTFLLGRNVKALERVALIARQTSSRSQLYEIDLSSVQKIRAFVDCLKKEVEYIDLLIHSAGIISMGPLESASIDDFDRQYQINVRAAYDLTQQLLPMIKVCKGQIVFINSSAGLNARANLGQYSATKFALKAIADSFRQEINPAGVRVLSVYPGRTASPMQEAIYKIEGKDYHPELLMQPEDVADVIINALTLPHSAEVTEISVRPFIKSY